VLLIRIGDPAGAKGSEGGDAVQIGQRKAYGGQGDFVGASDDLRLYPAALTDADVGAASQCDRLTGRCGVCQVPPSTTVDRQEDVASRVTELDDDFGVPSATPSPTSPPSATPSTR